MLTMKYYLCKFCRNWADEFNVEGAKTFSEEEKKKLENFFTDHHNHHFIEVYFGTNEFWDDPVVFWKNSYSFVEITKETFDELNEKFPSGFGTFINIMDYDDEEE